MTNDKLRSINPEPDSIRLSVFLSFILMGNETIEQIK